jgi:large subunit ribosomal protein L28
MAVCVSCGKGSVVGRTFVRRGQAKKKAGVGRRIVRSNLRVFLPNLQRVKILLNGTVRRLQVCTACLRAGRVTKAPQRPALLPKPTTV